MIVYVTRRSVWSRDMSRYGYTKTYTHTSVVNDVRYNKQEQRVKFRFKISSMFLPDRILNFEMVTPKKGLCSCYHVIAIVLHH